MCENFELTRFQQHATCSTARVANLLSGSTSKSVSDNIKGKLYSALTNRQHVYYMHFTFVVVNNKTRDKKSAASIRHVLWFCGSRLAPSAASTRHLSASLLPRHVPLYSLPMPAAAVSLLHRSLTDVQLPSQSLVQQHCQLHVTQQTQFCFNQIIIIIIILKQEIL